MSVSVYVLNMRGEPLMPTTPRNARKLIEKKKAKVKQRLPFIIQLNYATGETKEPITVGLDSGYQFVGFSAITEKKELISGELELRKDVSKKLTERRQYRRTRRNRLWYRKSRFNNRVSTKKKGWFAPSIKHKLDSHKKLIEKIKQILPITKIIVEVATFDAHKMKKPEVSGIEYQQGELKGYEIREYLLEKWKRKCVYCKETSIKLEIEHIIPKSRGGTNRVYNLTISCRKCNVEKGDKTAKEYGFPCLVSDINSQ
ncbi:MAG: RNA-guided endonuclease IscB [Candidatus Kariarchaeaceae archaeon]